jgi:hypothetical protein
MNTNVSLIDEVSECQVDDDALKDLSTNSGFEARCSVIGDQRPPAIGYHAAYRAELQRP